MQKMVGCGSGLVRGCGWASRKLKLDHFSAERLSKRSRAEYFEIADGT